MWDRLGDSRLPLCPRYLDTQAEAQGTRFTCTSSRSQRTLSLRLMAD